EYRRQALSRVKYRAYEHRASPYPAFYGHFVPDPPMQAETRPAFYPPRWVRSEAWTVPVRHGPEAQADARAATSAWPQTIRENGPAREKLQMRRRVSGSVSRRQSNRSEASRQGVCSLLFSFCQKTQAPSL